MKKLLVLAAVTIASVSAFASKARLNALQASMHLSDAQDVVGHAGGPIKPDQAAANGEWVTLEWGGTTTATSNAEGGFVRKMGDNAAMGAYLGNRSDTFATFRAATTTPASYLNQPNPLNLYYGAKAGDMTWGLGLFYVSAENKVAKQKENITGLTASATSAAGWDAQLLLGLGGETKNEITVGSERALKAGSNMKLSGGYAMDTMYFYASYGTATAKETIGTTTPHDFDSQTTALGVVNSHKKDGTDFFYGIAYSMAVSKDKATGVDSKDETTTLPVIIGIEAEAASWLVLRGSITQNIALVGSRKVSAGTAAATVDGTPADSTTVAAGAGVKFGKFIVDGSFANAGTNGGAVGSDANFLTQASMTYSF